MSEAVAVIAGASISAVVALLAVSVQHTLSVGHQRRRETAERLAAFSAATHQVATRLGELAVQDPGAGAPDRVPAAETVNVNRLLSLILLLDDEPIVKSALSVDRELTKLDRIVSTKQWERSTWSSERQALSAAVDEFQSVARRHLGSAQLSAGAPRKTGTL